ncbi:serine hydrolase domain-containing protein, partial [Streptomyces sp. SBT349]|uniref:serine hydrolase domain-containing protein n=1 Tax=Streptomyces sp. SBT349 TaxID=1580539 RepID=UPI0007C87681
ASPGAAAAKQGPAGGTDAVRRHLDSLTGTDGIPGALARIRDGDRRAITLTSGTAELGTGRPMVGGDGRYRVGSVTKSFTAVAVLQLAGRGAVRLDEPIETYLPGVVRGTGDGADIDGRHISVRRLLQHTSGLPDYMAHLNPLDRDEPVEAAELVRFALAHAPDFDPGRGWEYSSTGYLIAGMLVERLTGDDIGTAVTERVIRPAGLSDTYWPPTGERAIRGRHARAYVADPADPGGPLLDVTEFEPSLAGASGALVSTPSDLNRFWQRLFEGRLLTAPALAEMMTVLPPGPGEGCGLGLRRFPLTGGGSFWGHLGDHLGTSTRSGRDASGRQVTAYITARTGSDQAKARLEDAVDAAFVARRLS